MEKSLIQFVVGKAAMWGVCPRGKEVEFARAVAELLFGEEEVDLIEQHKEEDA